MRASDGDFAAAILFAGFAAGLVDAVEDFAHVLDLLKKRGHDKNGFFLRCGDSKAVAWTRVHFHNLSRQLVLLLQNQPREVGGIFQIRDDDALDVDAEALKNAVDEVMRERAFLWRVTQKIADDLSHLRLDIDDKNFFVIANEQRATAVGGKNSADLNGHDIVLHGLNLSLAARNTSRLLIQCGTPQVQATEEMLFAGS